MSEQPLRAKYAQRKPPRSERPYALRQISEKEQAITGALAKIQMVVRELLERCERQEKTSCV